MKTYSIIDFGLRDFVRDAGGNVLTIEASCFEEAEDKFLNMEYNFEWTNQGTRYWCWEDEE